MLCIQSDRSGPSQHHNLAHTLDGRNAFAPTTRLLRWTIDFALTMEKPKVTSPIRLALYPSAHGLGHLTRIVHLAQLLHEWNIHSLDRRSEYRLFIRANIDSNIRQSLQIGWPNINAITFSSYKVPIQPGIVQTNPYTISTDRTWDAVRNFDARTALAQEQEFVKANAIDLIISDCPSIPCTLDVPAILVTNFTFDTILTALPPSSDPEIPAHIQEMTRQYNAAKTLIRLPGYIHIPYDGRMVEVPAHFRSANRSRYETLADLNIPELLHPGRKILLHCFGGQPDQTFAHLPRLPPHWVCLSSTIHAPPSFYQVSKDAHIPDLIAASDVVLGKLGWGMCSEVIGNGHKPFVYVPRSAFVEEEGLTRWMKKDHQRLVRMEVDAYEDMQWEEAILRAENLGVPMNGDLTAESRRHNEDALVGTLDAEIARLLDR
jgi:hypothetical protein